MNADALAIVSAARTNWESFANRMPFPESAGRKSILSFPGSAAYSRHTECAVESPRVAVFFWTNVSVRYHLPAYRACMAWTIWRPLGGDGGRADASTGGCSKDPPLISI